MTTFKQGDTVELINNDALNMPIGARATVTCSDYCDLSYVHWQNSDSEPDGAYWTYRFKLVETLQDSARVDAIDTHIEQLVELRDKAKALGYRLTKENDV